MTWLSVVIPCYGGERWIAASLASIAEEQPGGVEVILVDGSPTSTSRDIAQCHLPSLRVVVRPDLSSWQEKSNFGVEIAGSQHICWLGVDDVWLPGRLAAVRAWIESYPRASLHLAPSAIVDSRGRVLGTWRCPLPAEVELSTVQVTQRLLVQNFVAAPAPVFLKDAWLECGGLDKNLWYTADWDLWLKLIAVGPVYYHDRVTVGFRIHKESLTMSGSRDLADFSAQMCVVLDRHLGGAKGSDPVERAARASIAVNSALAAAAIGESAYLLPAVLRVLRLGPAGIGRYLRDSRIMERVVPRIRAKLTGAI
jgi:GT2 family glycosyltransferase